MELFTLPANVQKVIIALLEHPLLIRPHAPQEHMHIFMGFQQLQNVSLVI